jgi:outer membrane protein assembly factor BamB
MSCVAVTSAQLPTASRAPAATKRQGQGKVLPFSPFPSRTHFTLPLNSPLIAPPAYHEGTGYFPIEDDHIVAYDLERGMLLWNVPGRPQWQPTVGGDFLVIDQEDGIHALRTKDGSTAWVAPLPEKVVAAPVWDQGWLVAVTASEILAFRGVDGMPVWRKAIAGARAAPSIDADRLYQSLDDGRVLALRLETGDQIWERKLGGAPNAILALGDQLFVGCNDNFLYSLKAPDGFVDWRFRTGADVVSKPVGDRSRVYFVSLDNVLRAANRSNGVQQWKKPLPFRPAWPLVKVADTVVVAGISGTARAFFMKDGAAAGELGIDAASEIAAPLHAFDAASALGPMVIAVTRSIAEGATIVAVSHTIDPPIVPFAPLPGLIPVALPKQPSP